MARINFSWTAPTQRTDGSALDTNITYRLYEDGTEIVRDILVPNFSIVDAPEGTRTYHVTAFDEDYGLESAPSNSRTVSLVKPVAPANFAFAVSAS